MNYVSLQKMVDESGVNQRSIILSALFFLFIILSIKLDSPFPRRTPFYERIQRRYKSGRYHHSVFGPKGNRDPVPSNRRVSIYIIDTIFGPSQLQCQQRKNWIESLYSYNIVDSITFLSNETWSNKGCGITSQNVKPYFQNFDRRINPSCILFHAALRKFNDEQDGGLLFIVEDSAYIRAKQFTDLVAMVFEHVDGGDDNLAIGNCHELRDYFHMLLGSSGILLTRRIVHQLLSLNATWDVACSSGIIGDEALSHALMEIDYEVRSAIFNCFLGKPWSSDSDWNAIRRHSFSSLPICVPKFSPKRSCSFESFKFSDVIVWNGAQGIGKDEFIMKAPEYFSGVPSNIGVQWDLVLPSLCRFE